MNRTRILLLSFVIATFLASFLAESALWGLSAYRFMSINWGLLLAIFVLLLMNRTLADRIAGALSSFGRTKGAAFIAAAIFILIAFLLRSRHLYWGERLLMSRSIEKGLFFYPSAPLGVLVNYLFFRAVNSLFLLTGSISISLLSIIAGGCFVLGAFSLARTILGGDRADIAPGVLVVLLNGFAVIFLGSGGNTHLAALFSLLYLTSALLHVRGRMPLLVPVLLFLIASLSHVSALYLLPSIIYLLARGLSRGGRRGGAVNAAFVTAGVWIIVEIAARILWDGPGPATNLLNRFLASLSITGGDLIGETLMCALNALLVMGPATVAVFFFLSRPPRGTPEEEGEPGTGRAEFLFLTAAVIPAYLLCLAAGWRVEHGLRWHIVASTGPAFAVYTLFSLRRLFPEPQRLRRVMTVVAMLGLFHALPLVLTNAIPDAAERRLLSLPLSEGQGETILGTRALERGELDQAEKWLTEAAEKDSLNDVARYCLGKVHMEQDFYLRAVTRFHEAHMLHPASIQYRFDLAQALIEHGWYREAVEQLEYLTENYPDSLRFWKRLGYARNHGGMFEEAIRAYERALLMEPSNEQNVLSLVSALTNRGTELQKEGNVDEARAYYEMAIKLYPIGWAAQNNLAAMELELGNVEKAYGLLERALKRHPAAAKLNLNMGLALEQMGRYEEAYSYIRKSLELDPMSPGAEGHLNRLLEKAQQEEQENGGG